MLLNELLTWVHSQKDPRLHFGESFTSTCRCWLIVSRPLTHLFVKSSYIRNFGILTLALTDILRSSSRLWQREATWLLNTQWDVLLALAGLNHKGALLIYDTESEQEPKTMTQCFLDYVFYYKKLDEQNGGNTWLTTCKCIYKGKGNKTEIYCMCTKV